jgi:hypothetical protein
VKKERTDFSDGEASERKMQFFCPLKLIPWQLARKYFVGAGVFTGLGLWIGATVHFFSIGILAVGFVLMAFFMARQLTDETSDYVPELWRIWAVSAAIIGTFFYLVEYFPSHVAMRLEVNNPLYTFTLVCIGELIVRLTRWRLRVQPITSRGWFAIALATTGVALVPVLITAGPVAWYKVRDPQMMRLHYFITEFYSYSKSHPHEDPIGWLFRSNGILPLFLIGAFLLSGAGRAQLYEWAALWLVFFISFCFLVLMWWQVRWGWHYAALSIWLMIVVGHITWRNVLAPQRKRLSKKLATLLAFAMLVQAVCFATREYVRLIKIHRQQSVRMEIVDAVMRKNLARGLASLRRNQPFRFICEPDLTPALYFFAGIRSITSYYWENLDGLRAAAEFFGDPGETAAVRVARERGLTHVLVSEDEELPVMFNYIKTGSSSVEAARPTLLERLRRGGAGVPSWMELDPELTNVGQQRFELTTATGKIPWESRIRVYRIKTNNL